MKMVVDNVMCPTRLSRLGHVQEIRFPKSSTGYSNHLHLSTRLVNLVHSIDVYQRAQKIKGQTREMTELFATSNEASGSTNNAHASVLFPSEALPSDAIHIRGPDLSQPTSLEDLLRSYEKIGFQATGLARAIQVVEEMVCLPS